MEKDASGGLDRPAPAAIELSFVSFCNLRDVELQDLQAYEQLIREAARFSQALRPNIKGRRFCVTNGGLCGMVPERAEPGDAICVILGCAVPLVLKRRGHGRFELVGECYIHGLMDGEALDLVLDVDDITEQDILIE